MQEANADTPTAPPLPTPLRAMLDSPSQSTPRRRSTWTPDPYLRIDAAGYDLVLVDEKGAFEAQMRSGEATLELAVATRSPVVALLYRIGRADWKHVYYVFPLAENQTAVRAFVAKPCAPRHTATIRVRVVEPFERRTLIDQTTELDPLFSAALHRAVRTQADTPFVPDDYVRTVTLLALSPPTVATLRDEALATTNMRL